MITDVFFNRYPNAFYHYQEVPREVHVVLRQGAHIIFEDLCSYVPDPESLCARAYTKLVRELGHGLFDAPDAQQTCGGALCEVYDLWNDSHGGPGKFIADRLSLLELLMAELGAEFTQLPADQPRSGGFFTRNHPAARQDHQIARDKFRSSVDELNHRFRQADLPFHFHNGVLQLATDEASEREIHEPFWSIVSDSKWANVETDIKESIDRRDQGGRDAALYALKALESTVKIISDERGWTRGAEHGAAHYVDNLVSATNGRFIDPWEGDQLKSLFRDVRNVHGHGPGSSPQPALSAEQQHWAIECSMIWIKSLITRL